MSDSIVVERHIAAPPPVVYAYLTESDKWTRWQGIAAELHPRPGGSFLLSMANGLQASDRFLELVPHERVVFTWGWIDHPGLPPGSSTVEIVLAPVAEGTSLRLTHSGLPSDEIPVHALGWGHYLPRLVLVAEGGDAGPDNGPPDSQSVDSRPSDSRPPDSRTVE
jgi:uncharacterized protein YndB with AHSA1/START domain